MKKVNVITQSIKSILLLVLVTGVLVIQGCSSDSSVASEDASGLFTGTGIVNSATTLTDVRGFVHSNRFIFFDETEAVLYDGQISNIAGDIVTATADVYKDGAKINTRSVSVKGTVTSQSTMSLTFSGTGYADGVLTLLFDPLYNRGATIAKLAADSSARWIGDTHTTTTTASGITRILSSNDEANVTFSGDTSYPSYCYYDGIKSIPDSTINIYLVGSLVVTDSGFLNCDHIGSGYTGFFAVVDGTATDDTLLFAVTNGIHSNFSVMTK